MFLYGGCKLESKRNLLLYLLPITFEDVLKCSLFCFVVFFVGFFSLDRDSISTFSGMIMTHEKEEQDLQELVLSWELGFYFPRCPGGCNIHLKKNKKQNCHG